MICSQVLIDYGKCRSARVVIFVDVSDRRRGYRLLEENRPSIEAVASLFDARVLLVDKDRVSAEAILDNDVADAWLILVAEGQGRALSTKKNPQRINVDAQRGWEEYAFQEVLRQVRESQQISESLTSHYSRYGLLDKGRAAVTRPSVAN